MAKLTFKGDKPKRKKPKTAPPASTPAFVDGWTSATELADLNGPILVLGALSGVVKALAYDDIRQGFQPSTRLDALADADCVNFFPEISSQDVKEDPSNVAEQRELEDAEKSTTEPPKSASDHPTRAKPNPTVWPHSYPEIHRVEPTSVTQIFTVVSPGTKLLRYALKLGTTSSPYLSIETASGKPLLAHAIGPTELFEFTPVHTPNEAHGLTETRWIISNGDHTLALQEEGFVFAKKLEVTSTLVVRAHTSNTVAGARLKMLEDESAASGDDLQRATARLYKETGGKIKVGPELVARLRAAIKKGTINEQIVDEKARLISRW